MSEKEIATAESSATKGPVKMPISICRKASRVLLWIPKGVVTVVALLVGLVGLAMVLLGGWIVKGCAHALDWTGVKRKAIQIADAAIESSGVLS